MKATYVCSVLLREGERRDGARGKAWDVVRGWNPGGERNKDENWWVGPSPVENAPCAIYFAGEMDGPERTAWRREFTKVLNIIPKAVYEGVEQQEGEASEGKSAAHDTERRKGTLSAIEGETDATKGVCHEGTHKR